MVEAICTPELTTYTQRHPRFTMYLDSPSTVAALPDTQLLWISLPFSPFIPLLSRSFLLPVSNTGISILFVSSFFLDPYFSMKST
ncbi:hypothetical protein VTO42DRAFT_4511 [Malbranchea cinnamomea]